MQLNQSWNVNVSQKFAKKFCNYFLTFRPFLTLQCFFLHSTHPVNSIFLVVVRMYKILVIDEAFVYPFCNYYHTAWKESKYGVFSGLYFPAFSPNTGKYGLEKTPYLDTFHAVPGKARKCLFPVSLLNIETNYFNAVMQLINPDYESND